MKILVKAISVYLVLGTSVALAGEVDTNSITTFQAGTPALASEVNANFSALIAPINDNAIHVSALEADSSTYGQLSGTNFWSGLNDFSTSLSIGLQSSTNSSFGIAVFDVRNSTVDSEVFASAGGVSSQIVDITIE